MKTKLKPCPFCRVAIGKFVLIGVEYDSSRVVVCVNCGAKGPTGTDDNSAISAWNRRSKEGKS